MTDRPTATGAPGAADSSRPNQIPGQQLQAPASAVLDDAHVGDIQGAFGTVKQQDTERRRSWGKRLLVLLAIMGPGLIVMVGDNDAGGVSTYAQAGQDFGLSLLWTLPLLIPVLIVNQEMVVRLGAVTGVGHARLIIERFGKFWGAFSVGDLFILNFLTIATEFIGVSLALEYFGISEYIAVPIAAVGLILMTVSGQLSSLGALHVRLRVRQLPGHPPGHLQPPQGGTLPSRSVRPRGQGWIQLHLGAAHHRHRGNDGGALAAVLPAVQHHRQADHAAVDQLRAGRHLHRFARRCVRRRVADGRPAAAFAGTPLFGHFTNALGVARGFDALRRARYRGHLRHRSSSTRRSSAPRP